MAPARACRLHRNESYVCLCVVQTELYRLILCDGATVEAPWEQCDGGAGCNSTCGCTGPNYFPANPPALACACMLARARSNHCSPPLSNLCFSVALVVCSPFVFVESVHKWWYVSRGWSARIQLCLHLPGRFHGRAMSDRHQ